MAPKQFHGARAKVGIYDPTSGTVQIIGIWNSIDYRVTYDVQPSYILGRFSAAELTTTGVEPVAITASGWRIVGNDAYKIARVTNVKDLLTQEYLVMSLHDRQTGEQIATIRGCLPTGFSENVSAKALATLTNTYLGLLMDTETTTVTEAADATDLP